MRPWLLLFSVLACLYAGAAQARPCSLQRFDIPITWSGYQALIQIRANGQRPYAIIDSGAGPTVMYESGARRLGLRVRPRPETTKDAFGGSIVFGSVEVPRFAIFGQPRTRTFYAVRDRQNVASETVLLLGQDVLSHFDVEFNFPAGAMAFLVRQGDCSHANLAYWGARTIVPMVFNRGYAQLIVPVQLNGQSMRALLDTGAPMSVVSIAASRRAGVEAGSAATTAAGPASGVSGRTVDTWVGAFEFKLGDETVQNARLRIADWGPERSSAAFDMILGADFFRTHRVLAAYSQHQMYFSYIGGQVFRSDPIGLPEAQAAEARTPSAEGQYNRSRALYTSGDRAGAIAALDEAIRLNPDYTLAYVARGDIYFQMGQPERTIADYTEALRLAPIADYYHARAVAHKAAAHFAEAIADADQEERLAPRSWLPAYDRGEAYLGQLDFPRAIAEYTRSIALDSSHMEPFVRRGVAYERTGDRARAATDFGQARQLIGGDPVRLNYLCWDLGTAGFSLDEARAACDESLRIRPDNANVLDSRGMVALKQERFQDAWNDYDAAARIDATKASFFFGRGIAAIRLGRTAEGEADLAHAAALDPRIAETYASYGVRQ